MQAYQKRAPFVIDFLADLARRTGRRIPVRLVKGAYWDSEVKRAQVDGQAGYPVFTRKPNTDVSYLACARACSTRRDAIYPMFATHNAQTIAAIHRVARDGAARSDFEFQRCTAWATTCTPKSMPADRLDVPCRVYAPVGSHEDLLPYLVRRLLENGANSSFVNRITDEDDRRSTTWSPIRSTPSPRSTSIPHPRIPLPVDLYRSYGIEQEQFHGRQPRQRRRSCARSPSRSTPP